VAIEFFKGGQERLMFFSRENFIKLIEAIKLNPWEPLQNFSAGTLGFCRAADELTLCGSISLVSKSCGAGRWSRN